MTSTFQEAGKEQVVGQQHEGNLLRKYLKRNDIIQEDFATRLNMTVQNLSHHMRKERLTDDFKRLLKENGISLFSETENVKVEKIPNGSENIELTVVLKNKRIAVIQLPGDWTKVDLEAVVKQLKTMIENI